ncbi:hypothetical protein BLL37_07865 [Pseudomonas azotoformans]|uniref:Uncharacterized protein n=1 Tax=Pseudomonas azotoformans TaxID=47878 RepID=A0A1V2JPQ2_PSEAZ|nr:hypothetical protein BFL39_17210 [Pseudomonas azotoformans]ONH46776.1 hypothetical protein BLL37_07865 [Pseudomonas azotoformans]
MSLCGSNTLAIVGEGKAFLVTAVYYCLNYCLVKYAAFFRCAGNQRVDVCPAFCVELQSDSVRLMAQDIT